MSSTAGTNNGKDVIYIDVDDEITGIIDKVQGSKQKIIALVLPKRATVLQSIVNMKLLKRSADAAKKNLVLITGEIGLLPLAGTVGLHVAKSLQSRPEIPGDPGDTTNPADEIDDDQPVEADGPESTMDKTKTVGELAGAAAVESMAEGDDDSIDLGDEDDTSMSAAGSAAAAVGGSTKGKNKKFKIPNFNKFRLLLVLGAIFVIVLIVLAYICLAVLPKAKINIKTDSTNITSTTTLTLKSDPAATLDVSARVIPSTLQQTQKTQTQQVAATGQQNNGQKAGGTVSMSAGACSGTVPADVPAGTGLSTNGLTFISQSAASFNPVVSGGKCTFKTTTAIPVVAQQGGAQYNVGAGSFTVAGRADVSASSSAAMSGGTDDITKVVTQSDIDSAKQKISAQDTDPIKQTLKSSLIAKSLYAVEATFNAAVPTVTTSANVGDKADNVTVTEVTTYTMLGVHENDLQKVVADDVSTKIDPKKQSILDYGLDNPSFTLQSQDPNGATAAMEVTVVAGPDLDANTIKKQVAGKKAGDASSIIKSSPGVTDVTVSYSPFWVGAIPTNTSKITVVIEKPQTTTNAHDK